MMSGAVRMTWLFALVVFSGIYSVQSGCLSCNISQEKNYQVESWTFTVQNGIGTAKCCPQSGAFAGSYLYWQNGSDIIPVKYSSPDGCEAISVLLTDQHCRGMQVVCRTSWGSPVQKENISIEIKPCSSLLYSSNTTDLLQMCLNCTDEVQVTSTDSSQITMATTSAVSGAILSSVSVAAGRINHAYFPVFAVVAVLLLGIAVAAIIVVVVIFQRKNIKNNNYEVKQAEEGTGLLNKPASDTRGALSTSANTPSKETAVDSQVPVKPFAKDELSDHEPPGLDSSVPESSEDSQSSPLEQSKGGVLCSQSVDDLAGMVFQTNKKLLLPRSQLKYSDIVSCIPENDTRIKFGRSLSYPNS